MSCKNIAVLAFHDISPFHLSVPCLVFENRTEHGLPAFNLRVCAAETASGDLIRTCAGFMLKSELTLEDATDADVLIVPSWRSPQERPSVCCMRYEWQDSAVLRSWGCAWVRLC
ncbi:hypothetical protein [Pantoea sp. BS_8]|uniref:hypothetical protein n=1 Tax=Pantoea sp. BS_8 TaxID=3055781 RepID=UPI0035C121D9